MISIIITAYKEQKTIGKAIEQILKNDLKDYELIVTAPDDETLEVAEKYSKKIKKLKLIKDKGEGKPSALNLAVSKAKGELLVLTDGDVYVSDDAIRNLLESFEDPTIGAVSGNPISINSKRTMMGFWAYVLTNTANERRLKALTLKKRFFCSGYLFAIRKKLFPKLPKELLSEDGFISNNVYKNRYQVAYSKKSYVYIKYPTNFSDWIKQKKRSAGGYNQIKKLISIEIRSFKKESLGAFGLFKYVSNFRELVWLFDLFLARVYLWAVIYLDVNLRKKSHKDIWLRVDSTK